MSVLNNRREGEEGRTKPGRELSGSKTQHHHGEKAVIRLLIMPGSPGDLAGSRETRLEESVRRWRRALMSAGKVGFHSAIQPTKKKKKNVAGAT